MNNRGSRAIHVVFYGAFASFVTAGPAIAQVEPPNFVALRDTCKVAAEDDQYRIVECLYKPGKTKYFSTPRKMFFWLTDCSFRLHFADGHTTDYNVVARQAGSDPPFDSLSMENLGKSDCKVVHFQVK